VTVGTYDPPQHYRVSALMDDFVNMVNRAWDQADPVALATHVLWRLNHIHPFINGNGRTARAAAYFVLCVKAGGWLPGNPILPELLRGHRAEYVVALQKADASLAAGQLDLSELHALVSKLLEMQLAPFKPAPPAAIDPSDSGSPNKKAPTEERDALEPHIQTGDDPQPKTTHQD
jgi:Fic family protein